MLCRHSVTLWEGRQHDGLPFCACGQSDPACESRDYGIARFPRVPQQNPLTRIEQVALDLARPAEEIE